MLPSPFQDKLINSIEQLDVAGVIVSLGMGAKASDKDGQGRCPIHRALDGRPSATIVKVLLEAGADPQMADIDGSTTLLRAVRAGSLELTRTFISSDVPPNRSDRNGITPLMEAAGLDREDLCEALIAASHNPRAMVNAQAGDGASPLLRGAAHPQVALLLLSAGADPRLQDLTGRKPEDLCKDAAVRDLMRAKCAALDQEDARRLEADRESQADLEDVLGTASKLIAKMRAEATDPAPRAPSGLVPKV